MKPKRDPLLKTQPWKLTDTFAPMERVLHRIEADGVIEVEGAGSLVYREDNREGYYDMAPAIVGIVEFFDIAAIRHGLVVDVQPLRKLADDLNTGADLYQEDIDRARACITECKRRALGLRLSQADDIVKTIQISMEMDKLKERKAA